MSMPLGMYDMCSFLVIGLTKVRGLTLMANMQTCAKLY